MSTSLLRLVRLAPDPLGLYVRAGRLDQKDRQRFIASGSAACTGVVFEAKPERRRDASFARHPVTRVARGGLR